MYFLKRANTLGIFMTGLIAFLALPSASAQEGSRIIHLGNAQRPAVPAFLSDPGPVGAATTTALFAQVAVGGTSPGYTTVFTFLNTGSTPLDSNLIITAADGTPMNIRMSVDTIQATGSSVTIPTIPPGGTKFVTASALNASDPTKNGWARVESSGGTIGGVATFQATDPTGKLTSIAGVLSASTTSVATIPVDHNDAQRRYTGFAVANPSATDTLSIKGVLVSASGTAGNFFILPLAPGAQTARFVQQFAALQLPAQFQGSLVLIEQSGKPFSVVALTLNSDLLTAIPVIPSKAPGIN